MIKHRRLSDAGQLNKPCKAFAADQPPAKPPMQKLLFIGAVNADKKTHPVVDAFQERLAFPFISQLVAYYQLRRKRARRPLDCLFLPVGAQNVQIHAPGATQLFSLIRKDGSIKIRLRRKD